MYHIKSHQTYPQNTWPDECVGDKLAISKHHWFRYIHSINDIEYSLFISIATYIINTDIPLRRNQNCTYLSADMEINSFNYSTKNIPTHQSSCHKLIPIEKIENFIKRIRWKENFYLNKNYIYIYIYIYHHHVLLPARTSLTISLHFSLSLIASGRSSGLHPVSSHSCCM